MHKISNELLIQYGHTLIVPNTQTLVVLPTVYNKRSYTIQLTIVDVGTDMFKISIGVADLHGFTGVATPYSQNIGTHFLTIGY